jgi:hypothetical protein
MAASQPPWLHRRGNPVAAQLWWKPGNAAGGTTQGTRPAACGLQQLQRPRPVPHHGARGGGRHTCGMPRPITATPPSSRWRGPLLLLWLLAAGPAPLQRWGAEGIVSRCSACEAVAAEIQAKLDAESELRTLDIDLEGRIGPDGKRKGKRIEYRLSEVRVFELLEGVCEGVQSGYALTPKKPKRWASTAWMSAERRDKWRRDQKLASQVWGPPCHRPRRVSRSLL